MCGGAGFVDKSSRPATDQRRRFATGASQPPDSAKFMNETATAVGWPGRLPYYNDDMMVKERTSKVHETVSGGDDSWKTIKSGRQRREKSSFEVVEHCSYSS